MYISKRVFLTIITLFIVIQPVEKASNSLAFSNNLWYNIPGDEKC